MPSEEARKLNEVLRTAPKAVDMDLEHQREAGEGAEAMTAEPDGVTYDDAPEVGGLWARPANARAGAGLLYLYGGGYVISSPQSRRKFAGHLANAGGLDVLVPKYRLGPEHPFPGAVDDAVTAYEHLMHSGVDAGRAIVAGDSSAGGLTIATLLALRERGRALPAGAVGISPWADLTCSGESMQARAAVDFTCTKDSLLRMAGQYLDGHDAQDPLASPIFGDLTGLPPLLLIVGGDEILLDDSIRLARLAGCSEVDVTLQVWAGMQHVFPIYTGTLPESDRAVAGIGDWVRERTSG